ncbi:oxidoreductase [Methylomonas sp. 11b]|uniref:oxidoreductase n=1 Tax=Methylomonas sp. 11b TaxID=1168169 RepID=UPI0004B0C3B6|nr:hypothetical protein [Methylomonas sp. 11b]
MKTGLMISEATSVSAQGLGYPDTPGIWSEEQIDGWTKPKPFTPPAAEFFYSFGI